MKLRTKLWMSAFTAALLGVSPVAAQERLPAPGGAKPATPPAPAHGAVAPAPTYQYQPACCQPDCCDRGCGFTAGVEAVYLRAHVSEVDLSGHDYEFGWRVWAGVETADGTGIRARWFNWDESSPGRGDFDSHDITVVDVELTQRFDAGCGFSAVGSVGARYAQFEQVDGRFTNGIDKSYGIVLGLEVSKQVCCSTAGFLAVRESIMFGDDQDGDQNQTFTISEIQVGLEWRSEMGSCTLFVRGGVEAQFWAGVSDDDSENFGLFGGFIAVGIRR